MKKDYESKFEQDGLDKQIKKMKRRSMVKTFIISLVVSIVVILGALSINTKVNIRESEKALEIEKKIIPLIIPNGYILEASYNFEILGGKSEYKIARNIGPKSVVLQEYKRQFGRWPGVKSIHYRSEFRYNRNFEKADVGFWETGYRKMIFYHPDIKYKSYKDDFKLLEDIPDGKIVEMGLSFDSEYNVLDINELLPHTKKSWLGLNMFTDEYIENEKHEAENYDVGGVYIDEMDMIGVSMHNIDGIYMIQFEIEKLFDLLKDSPMDRHHKIHEKYYTEDRTDMPNMIAAIVYGTKEELMKLRDNPHIKASSIGVVEDLY